MIVENPQEVKKVAGSFEIQKLENLVVDDPKFLFTLISCVLTLIIYTNLSYLRSPIIGIASAFLFFLINAIFLANAFFKKEDAFVRLILGALLLIMLLGFVGWLTMLIYNLDTLQFTLVLFIVSTMSSALNRRVRDKDAN